MPATLARALVQSQRFDCRFINCPRDRQAVIALEIRDGRSRVDAQRAGDWTIIVPCILQGGLDVRDHLVGEQITVRVDWPIVIVIGLQWIVAIGRIPVAPVQEIISRVNENDRLTMIVPPVSVMPLVPVTAERFVKADMILLVAPLFAVGVFRRFGLFALRPGLWITVRDMPLRIYRRECLIVAANVRRSMRFVSRVAFHCHASLTMCAIHFDASLDPECFLLG